MGDMQYRWMGKFRSHEHHPPADPNLACTCEERGWNTGYQTALEDIQRWDQKVKATMPKSTQGPDHELQPAEPALDLLEPQPWHIPLRERLRRFIGRDPWKPYTGSWPSE